MYEYMVQIRVVHSVCHVNINVGGVKCQPLEMGTYNVIKMKHVLWYV